MSEQNTHSPRCAAAFVCLYRNGIPGQHWTSLGGPDASVAVIPIGEKGNKASKPPIIPSSPVLRRNVGKLSVISKSTLRQNASGRIVTIDHAMPIGTQRYFGLGKSVLFIFADNPLYAL